ncbi:hypothetical protein [Thermomonas sp.]|uniref:hypothetical protein n=1 Tax=Thermomonas sp. TaxID=1971895 RepID=UPI0024874EA1|nr:hypothetical protein [Thermomonas sp.]MDI1253841.1 hypothetical protein [Thermomonas sp.]
MTRLPAILAMILLLPAACAATDNTFKPSADAASQPTVDDSRVTLGLGQSTQLSDGSQLSYTSLVNDSRCAPDVQCVWAGDAEIALRWKPAKGSARNLRLHTNRQGGPTSARIGARTLTLVSLERGIGPNATLSITATP